MNKTIIGLMAIFLLMATSVLAVDDLKSLQVYTKGGALSAMGTVWDGNIKLANEKVEVSCMNNGTRYNI